MSNQTYFKLTALIIGLNVDELKVNTACTGKYHISKRMYQHAFVFLYLKKNSTSKYCLPVLVGDRIMSVVISNQNLT